MTTTKEESVPSEGPSKNELKKLAKKAEKAAKKAGTKGTPTGTAVTATTTSVPVHTPHQQNQPVSTQPTVDASNTTKASLAYTKPRVRLANLTVPSSSNSNNKGNSGTASLKVVWAAQLYRIDVQAAKSKDVPACAVTLFANKPCLLYDDQVVSGGGNAMAQTMAYMTTPRSTHDHRRSTAQHGLTESLVLDDWCEWERTVLRPATTGTVPDHEAAFDTLTEALRVSPTGIHIVGHQDSVADVCILATLLQDLSTETLAHVHQKHPLIATYLDAHRDAVEAARVQLAALVASVGTTKPPQQVDTNEPSLNKLVESIFQNVVYDLFPDAELPTQQHLVSKCQNPKHGDYQCNAAMPVFAALKKRFQHARQHSLPTGCGPGPHGRDWRHPSRHYGTQYERTRLCTLPHSSKFFGNPRGPVLANRNFAEAAHSQANLCGGLFVPQYCQGNARGPLAVDYYRGSRLPDSGICRTRRPPN